VNFFKILLAILSKLYDKQLTMSHGHSRNAMFEKLTFAPTLSDQVAQALLARIEAGQLRPGEKLPPEAVLAVEFGVSRTVVREAISRLKHEALLRSRQGSGVFVSLQPAMKPLKIDASVTESREEVLQIVELRRALESEAAAVAAQRRSSSQLAEIEAAFRAIDAEVAAGGYGVMPYITVHRAIAQATGNAYFLKTLDFLTQYLAAATRVTRANEARRLQFMRQVRDAHRDHRSHSFSTTRRPLKMRLQPTCSMRRDGSPPRNSASLSHPTALFTFSASIHPSLPQNQP
jgi:GntR family transcriptional regulator, transcriptional repressor for pyruvate dehydrogenase complex